MHHRRVGVEIVNCAHGVLSRSLILNGCDFVVFVVITWMRHNNGDGQVRETDESARRDPDSSCAARGLRRQINLGDRVVRVLDEADIRPVPAMDNRLLDHLLRRALGDQMSLVKQQNAVGPQGGEVKVMQHHADMQLPAGGEPFEQTQQVLLIVKVQRRGGLIEKQPALRRAVAP